jgi:glycerol-3-phosphate acyltransferase PlsX
MKIIIDAMGGDYAPLEIVKGALQAAKDFDVDIVLTGRTEAILKALQDCGEKEIPKRIAIRNATEIIEMCDDPAFAFRKKPDSSMTAGLNMLRDGEGDAFISAGSTGALLSGATLVVKRVRGIRRAAMAPLIPTASGRMVLTDCGANIECTPEYLLQFAYIGNFYAKRVLGIESPKVALLNIGAEESKGMPLQREAYALLKKAGAEGHINFIGNIEAKDAMLGGADVVVTDGFSGNVMLKTIEGVGSYLKKELKGIFLKSAKTKIAALMIKDGVTNLKNSLDPNETGGTPFLGLTKPVFKAHGSSNARAIRNAVGQAVDFVNSGMIKDIEDNIDLMTIKREE